MTKYSIIISGTPVAKARPRAFNNNTGHIRMYTPKRSKEFEYAVRLRAEQVFEKPLQGPVSLSICFYMPRPKRLCWKIKPMPAIFHTSLPDCDNLAKSCLDGLSGVAFINDSQVAKLYIQNMYHAGDEGPKTTIDVEECQIGREIEKI
jgi:Holliday junction resolvase RusA-like endonuclease